jgi:DNA-binding SARP family transcriptional activator
MRVYARLLGPPTVEIDGRRHDPAPGKRGALLYYLVWRGGWTGRAELSGLFWGERPEPDARANLRQALFWLRRSELAPALEIEAERLRFRGDSDLARFGADLRRGDRSTALQHWRGPFLDGWRLPRDPLADAWIEGARSDLHASWRRAASSLAAELEADGELLRAADVHETLWRDDPLDEGAVAAQLRLLRHAGRADRAARAADAFREAFVAEMEMEPDGALAELLQGAGRGPDRATTTRETGSGRPSQRLPAPTTSFVGREAELATLRAWIAAPEPRLLTLVGPGGAGKSRLALEAVRKAAEDGLAVGWAPLEAVDGDDDVPVALASAWDLFEAGIATLDALADRIGRGPALLAIDNAEHVVGGVSQAASALLEACPGLRVLVTSRRALGTLGERRIALDGLHHEPAERGSDAARLLLARARAVDASFAEGGTDDDVEAIGREVGGSPLALELLASWADVYGPNEMLAQVRTGLDLVAAAAHPGSQRSLRAVLDATVEHLSPSARDAYLRLAPFRGGFDLAAAHAVGVDAQALRDLARSALVRREGRRYARHPLVRRHARALAEDRPERRAEARRRHGEHFLRRLGAAQPTLFRKSGVAAAAELMQRDVANLREALLWAVEHTAPPTLPRAHLLFVLLERSFLLERDAQLTRELIARSDGPVREHLRLTQWVQQRPALGARGLETEDRATRDAIAVARGAGDRMLEGRLLARRGMIRLLSGDPERALGELRQAARLLRRPTAGWGGLEHVFHAEAYSLAAVAQRDRGRYRAARHDVLRALAIVRRIGDVGVEELDDLAGLDLLHGRYDAALRVAVAARRCLPDDAPPLDRIRVLGREARVRMATGDLPGARRLAERRLAVAETLYGELRRDRVEAAHSLLGLLALLENDVDEAGRHLDLAGRHHVDLTRRARLALARGRHDQAFDLASDAVDVLERLGRWPRRPLELAYARVLRSEAVLARDGWEAASPYVVDALRWAVPTAIPPVIVRTLLSAAMLLSACGDEAAPAVARAVADDPRADHDTRRAARELASAARPTPPRTAGEELHAAVRAARRSLTGHA